MGSNVFPCKVTTGVASYEDFMDRAILSRTRPRVAWRDCYTTGLFPSRTCNQAWAIGLMENKATAAYEYKSTKMPISNPPCALRTEQYA